jgi:hypothetical protein
VVVRVEDGSGEQQAQTRTDGAGVFRLESPTGDQRLVVDSGSLDTPNAQLPDTFSWSGPLEVTSDVNLPLVLPEARRVSVAAGDTAGRALGGARIGVTGEAQVARAKLWPGGPEMTGRQLARREPLATDATGRTFLWSFPTENLSTFVEYTSPEGAGARSDLSTAITGDTTLAAMPQRNACTRPVADLGPGPVRLVSDLDAVTVRDSASKQPLIQRADEIVTGGIPAVVYNSTRTGDAKRYLYDEGVALRRITGILAYAYAATKDPKYLDTMASTVALKAAAWPDWNPDHPLDTAQIATAVSLAYGWSSGRMTPEQRAAVSGALVSRMALEYSCGDGRIAATRKAKGNQNTVIATAAVLTGLAVRNEASVWGSAAVADGTAALERVRRPDGRGRSLASGPTVEGLMYTTYEAASLALLHATARLDAADPPVATALKDRLADLGVLADWTERCGTIADPAVEDAWDVYPWVDRTTALAALTAWPTSGSRVLHLLDVLQAEDSLLIPDKRSWDVPDGIAELIVSGISPQPPAATASGVQAYAPMAGEEGSYWGCARDGELQALMAANPNNAPHGHRDIGNLVVTDGPRTVLGDLGQRDYNGPATSDWRVGTKAHSTVGVREADGRVTQTDDGWGSVSATDGGLQMVTANGLDGIDWRRGVAVAGPTVTVRDELQAREPGAGVPLSMSFLLGAPVGKVKDLGEGRVRFVQNDGTTWELTAPQGVAVAVTDAQPTPPYRDTVEFSETLGPRHSLVTMTPTLVDRLDLTTTLTRVAP